MTVGFVRWPTVLLTVLCGAAVGWAVFAFMNAHSSQPSVPWAAAIAVAALAICAGALAWWTWRHLRARQELMEPSRAVALVAAGKSALLAGAFITGGYLAVAIFNCRRLDAALPRERFIVSIVAAVAGFALAAAGRILEHACRGRHNDDSDDGE